MTRGPLILEVAIVATLAFGEPVIGAEPDSTPAARPTPAAAKPPAAAPSTARRTAAPDTVQATPRTKTGERRAAAATEPKRAGPRTLDDIHIEGEIPVPQVLFITARDQRRFIDLQHGRYLKTSRKVGEETLFPSWIALLGSRPTDVRKEPQR